MRRGDMVLRLGLAVVLTAWACAPDALMAQEENRPERHPGTAVIRVADGEYTIPLECRDSSRPELGLTTEPQRVTR